MIAKFRDRGVVPAVEAGMATAEYAVGCIAAAGFGWCLVKLLTSDRMLQLLDRLVREGWLDMHVGIGS